MKEVYLQVEMATGGKDTEVDLAYAIREIVKQTEVSNDAAVRVLAYTLERYQRDAYQNQSNALGFAGQASVGAGQLSQRGLR